MSTHLRPISEKEKEYAKTIFPSTGYYKKSGEVWCHCCGNIEYMTFCVTREFKKVSSIQDAVEWMDRKMNGNE